MKLFLFGFLASSALIGILAAIVIYSGGLSRPQPVEAVEATATPAPSETPAPETSAYEGCVKGKFIAAYPDGTIFEAIDVYLCGDNMVYTNNPKGAKVYNVSRNFD